MSEWSCPATCLVGAVILALIAIPLLLIFQNVIVLLVGIIVCTKGTALVPLAALLVPVAWFLGFLLLAFLASLGWKHWNSPAETEGVTASDMPPVRRVSRNVLAIGSYIRSSRKAGIPDHRITADLQTAGWPEEDIQAAFFHVRLKAAKDPLAGG